MLGIILEIFVMFFDKVVLVNVFLEEIISFDRRFYFIIKIREW